MTLRLATLKDGRKAIIIRTSDRISFKSCRRKWGWSSHLKANLGSKYLMSPLWFGSAIHYALEDYHGYNYFERPSQAFTAYCIATSKQHNRDLPDDAQEHFDMGVKMMDYYVDHWLRFRKPTATYWAPQVPTGDPEFDAGGSEPRDGWIPQVEVNFEIPIPLDQFPVLRAYAEAQGADCVLYRGTIDRVGIDDDGVGLWCIAKDTWVGSSKGIYLIQDHPDAMFMGFKETVIVCAEGGYKLECTHDHQVLTANRGWVEAQDLTNLDELVIGDYWEDMPQEDWDTWWTTGYWFGDGSLRNHGRGSIDFSTGHDNEELSEYLNMFFSRTGEQVRYAANRQTTGYAYVTNQAVFADHLRSLFSTPWDQGQTKYKKNSYIPLDRIGNICAFLSGLFDADGTVSKRRDGFSKIALTNKSRLVLEQVQQALAILGIKSSITSLQRDQYKWSTLTITSGASVDMFRSLIGFRLKRKRDAITVPPSSKYKGPKFVELLPGREVEVYDVINQPNTQFNASGLQVHNCVEYKTAKRAENFHYQTDSQITTYCWAMSHIYKRPVYGVKYYQFIKNAPEMPRVLGNGKISTASNLVSSAPLYRAALERMYGSLEGRWPQANKDKLVELMHQESENRDRYVVREVVRRNNHMINAEAEKILLEVEDMINPNLPLYPNPTRECSRFCSFLAPCVTMDDGGDWEWEIEQEFSQRDQEPDRLWRKRIPSVEALKALLRKKEVPDLLGIQRSVRSTEELQRAAIEAGEPMDIPTFKW